MEEVSIKEQEVPAKKQEGINPWVSVNRFICSLRSDLYLFINYCQDFMARKRVLMTNFIVNKNRCNNNICPSICYITPINFENGKIFSDDRGMRRVSKGSLGKNLGPQGGLPLSSFSLFPRSDLLILSRTHDRTRVCVASGIISIFQGNSVGRMFLYFTFFFLFKPVCISHTRRIKLEKYNWWEVFAIFVSFSNKLVSRDLSLTLNSLMILLYMWIMLKRVLSIIEYMIISNRTSY